MSYTTPTLNGPAIDAWSGPLPPRFSFSFDTPRQSVLSIGDFIDVGGVVCRIVGVRMTLHEPTLIDLGDGTRMVTDATVEYDVEPVAEGAVA